MITVGNRLSCPHHSLDPLGHRGPFGEQQMALALRYVTVAVVQRIGRLVDALGQQLLDANVVGRVVVVAEAFALEDKVHDRVADGLAEEAGLLFVETVAGGRFVRMEH